MKRTFLRPARALCLVLVFSYLCADYGHVLARNNQAVIGRIIIDGHTRFSDVQIASAAGLKIGQTADPSALDTTANRLSETGALSEVGYNYQTAQGKMTVTFHIVEEPKTMSCMFDNFVWFTPEEVDDAVRAEVPLFDGRVPVDGSLPQAVTTALEHLLAQRHITGSVIYRSSGPLGKPPTEYLYQAQGNMPTIKSVDYAGGSVDRASFSVATQRLVGHPYSRNYARELSENDLDVVYQNLGYLRAHFDEGKATFVPGADASDPGSVSVVFTVAPGIQYVWNGDGWNGNQNFTGPQLDQLLAMTVGQVAAADKISAGLDAVREAYGKKGYVAAVVSQVPTYDAGTKQVRFSFSIEEGNQYHMGAFSFPGVNAQVTDRASKAWRLKQGDVFDFSYPKEFISKDFPAAITKNPISGLPAHFSISTKANKSTSTVDVTLNAL